MLKVLNLRTEYKINPIGLETPFPRFSWEIESAERNVFQSAYEIRCAGSPEELTNRNDLIWDSGQVKTDQSNQIEYKGKKLLSGQRIWWQVRVWSNKNDESEWSEPAFWEMGLLDKRDWKASWIGTLANEDTSGSTPCPFLRKEFIVRKKIKKATVYVTSYGLYELSLNGKKVGSDLFTPGWTSYHRRLQYQVYDVTEFILQGRNAAGAILGDGWYRGFLGWQGNKNVYGEKLSLLFQLRLLFTDGTADVIVSDADWKSSIGPILKSDIYNGEIYDARLETEHWNEPDFDDSLWTPVQVRDYGSDNLIASEGVPVRVTQLIRPVSKWITPRGELVFDMGQNMVGWVKIRLKGKRGGLHRTETCGGA
ncbi:MAG: family 78 glycoside hydrolase catalytic domain [Mangrovibacterium sp.]